MQTDVPNSVHELLAAGPPPNGVILNCPVAIIGGIMISIAMSFAMTALQAPVGRLERWS